MCCGPVIFTLGIMITWLKDLSPRIWIAIVALVLGIPASYFGCQVMMARFILQDHTCKREYEIGLVKVLRSPESLVLEQKRLNDERTACMSKSVWQIAKERVAQFRQAE